MSMNIAVVAASGRSGKVFVEDALKAGHSISAGAHNANTLSPHPRLVVVECDATKKRDVENLIRGQDAVVSLIGHVKGSPRRVQTDAMNILHQAMRAEGIDRLVSLTGTGVRFPGDNVSIVDRILNGAIMIIDPQRIQDGKEHVELLQKSDLDWTVIRVLKLQNTNPKPFRLRLHGPAKWIVGRKEVAQAILRVLEERSFSKKAPIIGRR